MIHIKYFAKYRESLGLAAETMTVASVSLQDLMIMIREKHPKALIIMEDPRCIIAVNQSVERNRERMLQAGDEVAFYPPVTGG